MGGNAVSCALKLAETGSKTFCTAYYGLNRCLSCKSRLEYNSTAMAK